MLANLKFIKAVVSFLLESIDPLMKGTGTEDGEEEEVKPLQHQVSPVSMSHSTGGKESRIQISVEVVRPLIALLEDAKQMDSTALVCQVNSDLFLSLLQVLCPPCLFCSWSCTLTSLESFLPTRPAFRAP